MSILLYNPRLNWETKRVLQSDVVEHLLSGWFISPYSAIKEGR